MIDHAFQKTTELFIAMNLEKYNSLPKHLQKLLNDVAVDLEPYMMGVWGKASDSAIKKMKDAGVKLVKFPPEDAKHYLKVINDTWWDEFKGMVSPERFDEAKRLILK